MTTLAGREEVPLDSMSLYNIANHLFYIVYPLIILLGTFGNVVTIIIMHRTTSGESAINYYFTGIAVTDLMVLLSSSLTEWLSVTFEYELMNANSALCKMLVWISTGSGTISCWFLVCLTLHRAMSVVWPHRVNVMCTRRTVLCLMTGITLCFAALYAHYLYGFGLFVLDDVMTCMMQSVRYMQFVFDSFVYIEIAIYSVIPFAFLVLGNSILVWKLSASMKEAHSKLSKGNTEQILAREKVASSVTLTVIVVSVTFIILTLPVSVNYILSYFDRQYNQVTGYEYAKAHMFYTISILLADSNSAVNFYLYCLTGKRFREEFFRTICCGRVRQSSDHSSVPKAMSVQSA
ncbi:hypothetical protein ACOMHN_045762 [Nucella lapillus]